MKPIQNLVYTYKYNKQKQVGKVSSDIAAAKNGKVGSNFAAKVGRNFAAAKLLPTLPFFTVAANLTFFLQRNCCQLYLFSLQQN